MFVKTRCLINVNYSQVSALNTAFLFSPAKLHYFFIIKLFHIIKLYKILGTIGRKYKID